ncbi:hypothetical protein DH2020_045062 [Rehmannia glutinosa]|uniref:Uncharacterized protein n=1 Tax=Rehmannia glutinosa TaxID=99300 RepID=A0ABR0UGW9_REHGL
MARTGIKNTKMLFIKPFSVHGLAVGRRCMSKLGNPNDPPENTNKILKTPTSDERRWPEEPPEERRSCWMPHPRTGIYFPVGQDWVMDDVPNDAASFDCTFWLRSIDGVVDHKTDTDNFMDNSPN